MGFFSSRLELNKKIKSLESEIESIKASEADKSEQIAVLVGKMATLSHENSEYERKYINTGIECRFCYTVLQEAFVFCPKCGKKREAEYNTVHTSNQNLFATEPDGDGVLITKYNGFDEKVIVIPSQINGKRVVGIADNVFKRCLNIEELIFENGCEYIGNSAFEDCGNMSSIKFPKTLKEIGENAFYRTGIQELVLPPKLTAIGEQAFSLCKNLKNVVISENLKVLPAHVFYGCKLETIDIPDNIVFIDGYAFASTLLQEVVLPKSLREIGFNAFDKCTEMQKIVIPSNVTKISNFIEYIPITVYCAADSEAQRYARQRCFKMVQIDSVPKPENEEKIVYSIVITFINCPKNINCGVSQEYFPQWIYGIIGGSKISRWHWRSRKDAWGKQVYSTKPYTLSEAEEIKRKIEMNGMNMNIKIEFKICGE